MLITELAVLRVGVADQQIKELRLALAAEREKVRKLREDLGNISNARTWDRNYFEDEIDFVEWAKSRARSALAETETAPDAKEADHD